MTLGHCVNCGVTGPTPLTHHPLCGNALIGRYIRQRVEAGQDVMITTGHPEYGTEISAYSGNDATDVHGMGPTLEAAIQAVGPFDA